MCKRNYIDGFKVVEYYKSKSLYEICSKEIIEAEKVRKDIRINEVLTIMYYASTNRNEKIGRVRDYLWFNEVYK